MTGIKLVYKDKIGLKFGVPTNLFIKHPRLINIDVIIYILAPNSYKVL